MAHYNTGIKESIPSLLDLSSATSSFLYDFVQLILGQTQTSFSVASIADTDPGVYDPVTRSWCGKEGLRYRVPLGPIPSERHTREKVRNIKIMMDSCRRICVEDQLPSTPEERRFWYSYRFMKYQMVLAPACIVVPPLYIFWKMFHDKLPRAVRGRSIPLLLGLGLAEQWAEATYPGHQLLSTALKATTPMGDAARAEWARLQPVDIPFFLYSAYQFHHFLDSVPKEYLFGGDIASLCA
eukprot:gene6730-4825_t